MIFAYSARRDKICSAMKFAKTSTSHFFLFCTLALHLILCGAAIFVPAIAVATNLPISTPTIDVAPNALTSIFNLNNLDSIDDDHAHAKNFLVITDIHFDHNIERQMNINPRGYNPNNDLDKATFTKMLNSIDTGMDNEVIPQPDFILVLGDLVGHNRPSSKDVFVDERTVFRALKKHFAPIPIFYVFGNNDSFEDDYGTFNFDSNGYGNPYRVARKSGWRDGFLSTGVMCRDNDTDDADDNTEQNTAAKFPCIINETNKGGYYSAYLDVDLRLIVLNSILFSTKKRTPQIGRDTQKEFEWLANQLQEAKDNNESVLIATHIPPGENIVDNVSFWRDSCKATFLKTINAYKNSIIGILVGHTHSEEFKIIQLPTEEKDQADGGKSNPIQTNSTLIDNNATKFNDILVWFTPGMSTSHGNTAAIKTFYMNQKDDKWQLSDYQTFVFHVDKEHHKQMELQKLYDYQEQYCKDTDHVTGDVIDMRECLDLANLNAITANLKKYYTAGNPYFSGIVMFPWDVVIK